MDRDVGRKLGREARAVKRSVLDLADDLLRCGHAPTPLAIAIDDRRVARVRSTLEKKGEQRPARKVALGKVALEEQVKVQALGRVGHAVAHVDVVCAIDGAAAWGVVVQVFVDDHVDVRRSVRSAEDVAHHASEHPTLKGNPGSLVLGALFRGGHLDADVRRPRALRLPLLGAALLELLLVGADTVQYGLHRAVERHGVLVQVDSRVFGIDNVLELAGGVAPASHLLPEHDSKPGEERRDGFGRPNLEQVVKVRVPVAVAALAKPVTARAGNVIGDDGVEVRDRDVRKVVQHGLESVAVELGAEYLLVLGKRLGQGDKGALPVAHPVGPVGGVQDHRTQGRLVDLLGHEEATDELQVGLAKVRRAVAGIAVALVGGLLGLLIVLGAPLAVLDARRQLAVHAVTDDTSAHALLHASLRAEPATDCGNLEVRLLLASELDDQAGVHLKEALDPATLAWLCGGALAAGMELALHDAQVGAAATDDAGRAQIVGQWCGVVGARVVG